MQELKKTGQTEIYMIAAEPIQRLFEETLFYTEALEAIKGQRLAQCERHEANSHRALRDRFELLGRLTDDYRNFRMGN
jgi:hypothetical protein